MQIELSFLISRRMLKKTNKKLYVQKFQNPFAEYFIFN